jgi:hypothetical protein
VKTRDQPRHGWTTVQRRLRAYIVEGQPEGGYTSAFKLICCDCGDHPDLAYSESHPGFNGSAGHTRSRTALQQMTSTSSCTSSRSGITGRGR